MQNNTQRQVQTQIQTQTLSPQQLIAVKLLELPISELEQRVNDEIEDNPALEINEENSYTIEENTAIDSADNGDNEISDEQKESQEELQEELQDALKNIGSDDVLFNETTSSTTDSGDNYSLVGKKSSIDELMEQICEYNLTDQEKDILEYLIGSLDSSGYLRKDLGIISDELAISYNIFVSEKEIESVLNTLKQFDPAGIGAKDLQECLLLQVDRKPDGKLKDLMLKVLTDMFREFTLKHWEKIQKELGINDVQAEYLFKELRKLNPRPGISLGDSVEKNDQQIIPDFIVDTHEDGTIVLTVNKGGLPDLKISKSFEDIANQSTKLSKRQLEASIYAKEKVGTANIFINALKQRYQTMYLTMNAIIMRQRRFFEEGDEALIKPMILKDIASDTGLDLSTISRVNNSKYVQTKWGIYPLRFFFGDSYFITDEGETLSVLAVKQALKELIDKEDKKRPFSDDKLAEELNQQGYPVARRTVSKYREQMNIPVARLRKE